MPRQTFDRIPFLIDESVPACRHSYIGIREFCDLGMLDIHKRSGRDLSVVAAVHHVVEKWKVDPHGVAPDQLVMLSADGIQ
jgi:hypothetical protein